MTQTHTTRVQVYHNRDAHFMTYKSGDRLLLVWEGEVDAQWLPDRPSLVLERTFELHNVGIGGNRPDNLRIRSLSVGDVVGIIECGFWCVMATGWAEAKVRHEQVVDRRKAATSMEVYR